MKLKSSVPGVTAGLALSFLLVTGVIRAADANPPAKPEGSKTVAERERDARAAALQAIKDAVEHVITRHPEISPELKASLRSSSVQEAWVRSVSDAAKKALETMPLPKGVELTDAMRRDFQANALKNLTESTVEEIVTRSLAQSKDASKPQPGQPPGPAGARGRGLAGVPRSTSASTSFVHTEKVNNATGEKTVDEKQDYKVNGKEVSKEEYARTKAQIDGLANDLAQLVQGQRR